MACESTAVYGIMCNSLYSRNTVSKKGYLDIYGEQDAQWHRKYVVSWSNNNTYSDSVNCTLLV